MKGHPGHAAAEARAKRERAAKAKTPPPQPETTEGASTEEACLVCQKKPLAPCDVDKIIIEVEGCKPGHPDPVKRKLEITTSHRRKETTKIKDEEVQRLLRQDYDVLIDIIADVDALNFPAPLSPAKIKGRAYYHGRQCSDCAHAELELKPVGKAPELGDKTEVIVKKLGASQLEMPEHSFFARRSFIDVVPDYAADGNPLDEVTNVFGMITMLWHMKDYREARLVARSCGLRAKEDSQAANLNLRAGVRIFRNSKMTVGIAIPPLGAFVTERDSNRTTGEVKRKTGVAVGSVYSSEETKNVQGDSVSVKANKQVGSNLSEHIIETDTSGDDPVTTGYSHREQRGSSSITRTAGKITRDDVSKRLEAARGFDVVIAHNGTEVKNFNPLKKLKDLINDFATAVADVQKLFDNAPQLGWKVTFQVSVLAGSIVLEWFPDYVKGVQANGRYLAVEHKLEGHIKLEVFNITASISLGVDWRKGNSGLVMKVVGTLNGKAEVSAPISLGLLKPTKEIAVATQATAALEAVGHAELFGKVLADAKLKGEGGIELVDGKLTVRWDKRTCDLTGRVDSKPVMVTGHVRGVIWDTELDPVMLMERKTLYTFK